MYTLGINAVYHDSSACLVKDGQVVAAAEEERFTHIKHRKRAISFSTYEHPTGTYINADGGTFIQGSAINSGQVLPKTATFSTLPKAGVLYEVRISEGYYAEGTYQTEHFQR